MKVCFVGDSHAPTVFRCAAEAKGFEVVMRPEDAELVFVSQDTPTDERGVRDLTGIRQMVYDTLKVTTGPVILTSQVTPGVTRLFNESRLYHQAETLRIKDAFKRAMEPEQAIIGAMTGLLYIPQAHFRLIEEYFCKFVKYPINVIWCSYEEAEFSKIAINVTLANQVNNATALAARAKEFGCNWETIKRILRNDHRIGQAYLDPGNPLESRHILRDWRWFNG